MKQITHIKYGSGLEAEIRLKLDRELTAEEESEARKLLEQLTQKINNNTFINSEEFKKQIEEEQKNLLDCFECPIYFKKISNQYGGLNPWYEVTTIKGIIVIGWRKRVINIDWSDSDITGVGREIFAGEETTGAYEYQNEHYIHAWSYEKAKEYITKLLS